VSGEGNQSNFKAEIFLLLVAIVLFAVSAFFYSYEGQTSGFYSYGGQALGADYPYRGYAISFVGFGSVLMVAASISYLKRSKNSV
jgi:hypothetical protein